MPTPRRLLVVTTVHNKIYAIGGMRFTDPNDVTYSNATEEYDPLNNTWTPKADIPLPPAVNSVLGNLFIGGVSAHGKIYVVVFHTAIPGGTATYEYDPIEDVWDTKKAPVPFSHTAFSAASLHNKMYVLTTDDAFVVRAARLAEYDPTTNIWIIKPPTPTKRRLLGLAATHEKLYAIGGLKSFDPSSVVATVEEFDPSTNQWDSATPMHTARHSAGLGTINGNIYVIGGADASSVPLAVVEKGRIQFPPFPTCDGLTATLVGTEGDDILQGTAEDEVIVGLEGNDIIYGHGGNDVICGGSGSDLLFGGEGNDRLFGEGGDDVLNGQEGDDVLDGGGGNDTLRGGGGNDQLFGGSGQDTLHGGAGVTSWMGGLEQTSVMAPSTPISIPTLEGVRCPSTFHKPLLRGSQTL